MLRSFESRGGDPSSIRTLDVRPDETDTRDYIFIPTLKLLPEVLDPRPASHIVLLDQGREGACVGHALASVINLSVLRRTSQTLTRASGRRRAKQPPQINNGVVVSERMLYEMGRRYDEWKGEHYEGTSLQGAMKGWHKHGVCSRSAWPYEVGKPGYLTQARAAEAMKRPLGAYYRITDSDVSHVQAAIHEGDAVLASAWIHAGWEAGRLQRPKPTDVLQLPRIPTAFDVRGLHAFALIGYGPEGFIVQNSWGNQWGDEGLAILGYDDWFENRQDAWVARLGPMTLDNERSPKIFLAGFQGKLAEAVSTVGTAGADGLGIDPEALSYLINTGDKGELSTNGRMETKEKDLPRMASLVRLAQARNGFRDVVLYAHGGLVSETSGAQVSARLWRVCQKKNLPAYFFVWEAGIGESLLGLLRSRDDAFAPRAGFDLGTFFEDLADKAKETVREAQRGVGRALAPIVRAGWKEMHERASGASTAGGGAALFADALFKEMERPVDTEKFRLHLVGHSAGSIYLARLYERVLRDRVANSAGSVVLGSISFLAPALSVTQAESVFAPGGNLPVPSDLFRIFVLSDDSELADNIGIYPSSLLTYVADCLEGDKRVPLAGIGKDLRQAWQGPVKPTIVRATVSDRHGDFDDSGHEVEELLKSLAG